MKPLGLVRNHLLVMARNDVTIYLNSSPPFILSVFMEVFIWEVDVQSEIMRCQIVITDVIIKITRIKRCCNGLEIGFVVSSVKMNESFLLVRQLYAKVGDDTFDMLVCPVFPAL